MSRTLLKAIFFASLPFAVLFGAACEAPEIASEMQSLGTEGRWRAPAHILADGDSQSVTYTGAGPWFDDERSCQGTFTDGGAVLRDYLLAYFPQIDVIGGYSCRPIVGNPSQTSVHATGRALDLMIRTTAESDADNDLGDPIAHWLIQNSEFIGIQFIIWDRTTWGAERQAGDKEREYGGANPHLDHLHIELSTEAGAMETAWFASTPEPPVLDSCPPMPAEGSIIDDSNACTQLLGPGQFWRMESDQGYGDTVAWTNAVERDEQSNWARWQIVPSAAGEYEVEVFGGSEFSVHKNARYELVHGDVSSEFSIDQSEIDGWHSVGTFAFAAGGGQGLEVFDNNSTPVADDQHVAVDAIRVSLAGGPKPDPENPDPEETPDPNDDAGGLIGGCASNGAPGAPLSNGLLLLLFGACWHIRRRNRQS
jgi:hypothetical protein